MKYYNIVSLKQLLLVLPAITIIFSCNHTQPQLSQGQIADVKEDITKFAANISDTISTKGPIAWLNYFENSPDFFMASEGQVVFQNYPSAQKFIQYTLVKKIIKINLRWSNLRVDVLTGKMASIGSYFHEDIKMAGINKTFPIDGYFTGTAILTQIGWKLRNLHWSIKKH